MNHPHPIKRSATLQRVASIITVCIATCAALVAVVLPTVPASAQGPANFVFTGAGWGHGVGMSQNGARNMANQGLNHVSILNHYYPNTVLSSAPVLDNIRVHIGDASLVELSSAGPMSFERNGVVLNSLGSGSIQVQAHDGGLQVGSVWTTGSASDPLFVSFPQPVKISNNGHRYVWGKLQITNRNGKVRVVEVLSLEDYVAGIAEMPAAWPLEALMAQAIAARTYAHEVTLHRRASTEWAQEYDISGSTIDQNYIGWDAQDSDWDKKWTAAVKATAGVEIVDSNGPIRAYYSATNGGWTETADYVFSNDVPYTVAGPDPYDAGGHNWTTWTRTYSQSAMSRWLNVAPDTSVGTLTSITVLGGAGASARLDKATVELVGTAGTKRVTGKRLMLVMNAGIFGGGGTLDDHLPGTFTTIGNGQSAGAPVPDGVGSTPEVTPDPVPEGTDPNRFTPPPGWTPEPGTGTLPVTGGSAAPEGNSSAPADGAGDTPSSDTGATDAAPSPSFTPPPGWTPEPGTGTLPKLDGDSTATSSTPAPTPPPNFTPEPGTGTAPSTTSEATTGTSTEAFTPPDGWTPEPGTGTAPASTGDTSTVGGTGGGLSLPAGWEPVPGTGTPPRTTVGLAASVANAPAQPAGEFAVFRVVAPTDALADQARDRISDLEQKDDRAYYNPALVAGVVDSLAPQPANGLCTITANGIICASNETLASN